MTHLSSNSKYKAGKEVKSNLIEYSLVVWILGSSILTSAARSNEKIGQKQ